MAKGKRNDTCKHFSSRISMRRKHRRWCLCLHDVSR